MTARRITAEQKERMAELRERGWSYERIGRTLGFSSGCIAWHCLKLAVEAPRPGRSWDAPKEAAVAKRGNHVVRRFTVEDDRRLLQMESEGKSRSEIGRALGRRHNSITGRLMTLARRDERRERALESAQ